MKEWLLDRVPMWLRFRWPLRRFYWQPNEVAAIEREAKRIGELFR